MTDPAQVLIVEDDPEYLRRHRSILKAHFQNVSVDLAPDAPAVNEFLEQSRYDLILCDGNLDGFTGPELLSILRKSGEGERFYKNAQVPFILVTNDLSMIIDEELNPAANAVVRKGQEEALVAAIRTVLDPGVA
jgi:CheY-like chemotaxis protein